MKDVLGIVFMIFGFYGLYRISLEIQNFFIEI